MMNASIPANQATNPAPPAPPPPPGLDMNPMLLMGVLIEVSRTNCECRVCQKLKGLADGLANAALTTPTAPTP